MELKGLFHLHTSSLLMNWRIRTCKVSDDRADQFPCRAACKTDVFTRNLEFVARLNYSAKCLCVQSNLAFPNTAVLFIGESRHLFVLKLVFVMQVAGYAVQMWLPFAPYDYDQLE